MSLPAGFLDRPLAHYTSHYPLDRRPENSWAAGEVAPCKGYLIQYSARECGKRELCNQDEGISGLRQCLHQLLEVVRC